MFLLRQPLDPPGSKRQPTNNKTHKHHRRQTSDDGTVSTDNSEDDTTINTKSTYGTMKSIDDTRTIGTATVGTCGTLDLSYGDESSFAAFPTRMGTAVESLCNGVYDIFACGTIDEILRDAEKLCFPVRCCYDAGNQRVGQDFLDEEYSQPRRSKVRWSDKVENKNNDMINPAIRPEKSSEINEKMDMLLRLLKEKENLESGSVSGSKEDNVADAEKSSEITDKMNTLLRLLKEKENLESGSVTSSEKGNLADGSKKEMKKKDGDDVDKLDDAAVDKLFNEATKKIMSTAGDFDGYDVSKVLGVDTAPEPIVSTIVANKTTKAAKPVHALSGDVNDGAVSTTTTNTTKKTSKSEPVLQPWVPTPLSVSTAKTSNKAPRGRKRSVMKKLFGSSSKSHKKLSDENVNWEQQPFVADFSSPSALDSMGFPDTPVASDPFGSDCFSSPASSSTQPFGDNFFASDGFSVGVDTQTERKICAWCKMGDSKTKKKLKLCSACQSTLYCSPECQSKDWINGHVKTCRPCK